MSHLQKKPEDRKKKQILTAVMNCVSRWGVDRFSMADLATEADVARSTIYTHFKTKDEVIRAALLESAYIFGEKLFVFLQQFDNAQERVIETVFFGFKTLPEEPFLAMISSSALSDMVREHTLTTKAGIDIGTALMNELLKNPKIPQQELQEMSELLIRFLLSLLTMESPTIQNDDDLRGFIARRLLPSVGLAIPAQYKR